MNIIDGFTFGSQETDFGYARVPNGTGNFIIQYCTFAYNNDLSSSQEEFNDATEMKTDAARECFDELLKSCTPVPLRPLASDRLTGRLHERVQALGKR